MSVPGSKSQSLRIALLQLTSHGRDLRANLQKGEIYCRRAAAMGADLAVFPEMWSIGYSGYDADERGDREAWLSLAIDSEAPFLQRFRALASELGMAIAVTYLQKWERLPRNAVSLYDLNGSEVLHYAKVHLCPWDPPDDTCTSGSDFPVCELPTRSGPVRIGAMICFDREFPESARMLMLNGAELIITPNACNLDDVEWGVGDVRIAQFRVRAFENLVAVAMANYAAPENDGHSVAFYPDGSAIVCADASEQVVLAELDLDRVRAWRKREGSRDDPRSPEKYGLLTSPRSPRPLRS